MADKKKRSLAARILLTLAVVAIIILSALWIGEAIIARKITDLLEKGPVSLDGRSYVSDIGKVRVDFTRRSISVSDVTLRTDASRNTQDGPAAMLDMRIQKISASGIRYRKGGNGKGASIYIRNLEINAPNIIYEGTPQPERHDKNKVKKHSDFAGIIIKRLTVTDGNGRISRWKEGKKSAYAASGLNLVLSDILIGSPERRIVPVSAPKHTKAMAKANLSDSTDSRKPYMSELKLKADALSYTMQNGALTLSLDSLTVDSDEGSIVIGRMGITPQINKYQFTERVGDNSDWININVDGIALSEVKLPGVGNRDSILYAGSLDVNGALIESYKNRNQTQSSKIKPMLYQSIERIPLGIDIAATSIRNLNVRYEEVTPGNTEPGHIDFTDLDIKVKGLTNRPKTRGQQYVIDATGLLLGKGRINAVLTMPADSLNDHFSVRATLGAMPAATFTQITEPMANIRIASGEVRSAVVTIQGNSYNAESRVELLYDGLKVAILNKKKHDSERELLTFIANDFVIRRSNPERGKLRTGEGEFERNRQKSFWNLLWKTTFEGMKKVVL